MTSLAQQHPTKPNPQPLQDDLCLVPQRQPERLTRVRRIRQSLDEGLDYFSAQGLKDRELLRSKE